MNKSLLLVFITLSFTKTFGNTDIFPVEDVIACDMYILPAIQGNNLTATVAYYSFPGGTGKHYKAGDTIFSSTIIYAFDQDAMGFDEECFFIQIISHLPDLSQIKSDTACAYYMLPYFTTPSISGFAGYYTQPNKQGVRYAQGDTVFSSLTLFAYDGYETCFVEQEIHITIHNPPVFNSIPHQYGCQSYTFPFLPGENIFTDSIEFSMGNQQFQVGDITTSSGTVKVSAENGVCFSLDSFLLSVIDKISIDPLDDTLICGRYLILPAITGMGVTENAKYFKSPGGIGSSYLPGNQYNIANSTMLYAFDEIPGSDCRDEQVYNISSTVEPNAWFDFTITVCQGYKYNIYDLLLARNIKNGNNKIYPVDGQVMLETDSIFNTSDYLEGEYLFYVVDAGAFPCIPDTAIMAVVVTSNCVNTDKNEVFCTYPHGDRFLLSTNIVSDNGLVLGGYFLDENLVRILDWNQEYIMDRSTVRKITFYYVLEDVFGVIDTSIILIDIVDYIELGLNVSQLILCKGECSTISINFLDDDYYLLLGNLQSAEDEAIFNFSFIRDSISRNDQITVCYVNDQDVNSHENPDTIYLPIANHEYYLDLSFIDPLKECQDEPDKISLFTREENTFYYNETLCPGEVVAIDGNIFDENRPSGEILLNTPAMNGCDSFMYVNLSYYPFASKMIREEICDTDTVIINCIAYTPEFSSDTQVIAGGGAYGCDSTIFIDLYFTKPELLLLDTVLCSNQNLSIAGINFSEPGNYKGIIKKENLCDSILYDITIHKPDEEEISILWPMRICEGDTGVISVSNYYQSILWSTGATTQSLPVTVPGNYSVSVIDSIGCIADTTIAIDFDEGIEIEGIFYYAGGVNQPIAFDLSSSAEMFSITWHPSQGLNCDSCLTPVATLPESQLYTYIAINAQGCIDSGSVLVAIELDPKGDVFIPTAFNPLSTTFANTHFGIFTNGGSRNYELYIFDRWGSLLYSKLDLFSNDPLGGWDGRVNNRLVQSGVYVYRVVLEGLAAPIIGTITLIH